MLKVHGDEGDEGIVLEPHKFVLVNMALEADCASFVVPAKSIGRRPSRQDLFTMLPSDPRGFRIPHDLHPAVWHT